MIEFISGLLLTFLTITLVRQYKRRTPQVSLDRERPGILTLSLTFSALIATVLLTISLYFQSISYYTAITRVIYQIAHSSNFHIWMLGIASGFFVANFFKYALDSFIPRFGSPSHAALLRNAIKWGAPAGLLFLIAIMISHGKDIRQAIGGVKTPIFEVQFIDRDWDRKSDAKTTAVINDYAQTKQSNKLHTFNDFGLRQIKFVEDYIFRDSALITLHRSFDYAPQDKMDEIKNDLDRFYDIYKKNESDLSELDVKLKKEIELKSYVIGRRSNIISYLTNNLVQPLMNCMFEVDSELFYRPNYLSTFEKLSRNMRSLKIHDASEPFDGKFKQWQDLIYNILDLRVKIKIDYLSAEFRLSERQKERCKPIVDDLEIGANGKTYKLTSTTTGAYCRVSKSPCAEAVKQTAAEAQKLLADERPYLAVISSALAAMHREPLAGIAELDNWLHWAHIKSKTLRPLSRQIVWTPDDEKELEYLVDPDTKSPIDSEEELDQHILRVYSARAAWVQNHLIHHTVGLGEMRPEVALGLLERNSAIIKLNVPATEMTVIADSKLCSGASAISKYQYISWLMAKNLSIFYSTKVGLTQTENRYSSEPYWIGKFNEINSLARDEPWSCLEPDQQLRQQYTNPIDNTKALVELRLAETRSRLGVLKESDYVELLKSIKLRMQGIIAVTMTIDVNIKRPTERNGNFQSLAMITKNALSKSDTNDYEQLLAYVEKELRRLGQR